MLLPFLLLGFSVRCDSNRWVIPARKALLIIPAELGVCVYECVYVCEIKQKEEGGQSANHYGAFFFPSSSRCFESDF